MSWQGVMTTMVRTLIGDLDPTDYEYSDARIEQTILVSAQLVMSMADFQNNYSVNVEACGIVPDPTDDPIDNDFVNLVVLKAACIILGSEVKATAGKSISVKDGPSTIDMRGIAGPIKHLQQDVCGRFDQMLMDYKAGKSIAGQSVLGPNSPASFNFTNGGGSGHENRHNTFGY